MLTIIDYGLGNINAIKNIFQKLGLSVTIAKDLDSLDNVTKIILPGVGSFDWAMECINKSGMREKLDKLVIKEKIPVLGICVGMHIMCNSSDEGKKQGLNWINGKIVKFNIQDDKRLPVPHLGWNTVIPKNKDTIFKNLDSPDFYFLHSYYFSTTDKNINLADSYYGLNFVSAFRDSNIFGVQFHPEKSHENGIKLLNNFYNLSI